VAESCYLGYPHLARDLVTFTAEDDVWLASLSEAADGRGTAARRLTANQAPVLHPRLNPSATHVAWTSTRDGTRSLGRGAQREAYAASADGGPVRRLTYWGDRFATVRGWVSDNEVLVLSGTGPPATMKTWAFAVPLADGGNHPVNPMFIDFNGLVDGTMVTQPASSLWSPDGGWALDKLRRGTGHRRGNRAARLGRGPRPPARHRRPAGVAGAGTAHAACSARPLTNRTRSLADGSLADIRRAIPEPATVPGSARSLCEYPVKTRCTGQHRVLPAGS
jgi:hypothetical protein